jgi:hypothetical protein
MAKVVRADRHVQPEISHGSDALGALQHKSVTRVAMQ